MWLKNVVKKYIINRKKKELAKLAQFDDIDSCVITRFAGIALYYGSKKEDIEIGSNVMLYGLIASSNHGKVRMGKYSKIGTNCVLRSVELIEIGDFTAISNNVIISDNNSHSVNPYDRLIKTQTKHLSEERSWKYSDHSPIIIGKNCWIGENVRICKGVTIGDNAVVAADSVVTKSVPANSIVAGNPAKVVKTDIDKTTKRFFKDEDYPDFILTY